MLRPLTEADVEFEIECVPEDLPIQGNASAINDEADAQLEKDLRDQLERGNEWAWCLVRVTARWAAILFGTRVAPGAGTCFCRFVTSPMRFGTKAAGQSADRLGVWIGRSSR